MKSLIYSLAFVMVAQLLLSSSCERGKCPPNVTCTEVFSMVTVQVIDPTGAAVQLDEVYTLRLSNNEKIRVEQPTEGGYVVLDDNYLKHLQNDKDDFRFIGMKDGKKVLDELFVIGADCCHVQKIKGKEIISL